LKTLKKEEKPSWKSRVCVSMNRASEVKGNTYKGKSFSYSFFLKHGGKMSLKVE